MLMSRILVLSIFTLSSRVTNFQHFKGKYRLHFQGSKSPASLTLDFRGRIDISKSAIQPNIPERNKPRVTLIYNILLSWYVLAGCSIVKRKATNRTQTAENYAQWPIGR